MIDPKSNQYLQDLRLTLRRDDQLLWWDIEEISDDHWKKNCSSQAHSLNLITVSERAGAQSKSFNMIAKLLIGSFVEVKEIRCFTLDLFKEAARN